MVIFLLVVIASTLILILRTLKATRASAEKAGAGNGAHPVGTLCAILGLLAGGTVAVLGATYDWGFLRTIVWGTTAGALAIAVPAIVFGTGSEVNRPAWNVRTGPVHTPIALTEWSSRSAQDRLAIVQRTVLTVYEFLNNRPLKRTIEQYVEAVDRLLADHTVAPLSIPDAVYATLLADYPNDDAVGPAIERARNKLIAGEGVHNSRPGNTNSGIADYST